MLAVARLGSTSTFTHFPVEGLTAVDLNATGRRLLFGTPGCEASETRCFLVQRRPGCLSSDGGALGEGGRFSGCLAELPRMDPDMG